MGLAADTIISEPGNPQALNRYSYVLNNPLKYTDPTGHWLESAIDIAFIIYDIHDIAANGLSLESGAALALDGGGLLLPVVTGAGLLARSAGHADDVVRVVSHADEISDVATHADEAAAVVRQAENAGELANRADDVPRAGNHGPASIGSGPQQMAAGAPTGERPSSYRKGVAEQVRAQNDGNCVFCGKPADTIDHQVPWKEIKQGAASRSEEIDRFNDVRNLQPAFRSCNSSKGTRSAPAQRRRN